MSGAAGGQAELPVAVFDFFATRSLVRPRLTVADAASIAADLYGLAGTARELGSNQDRNFRIDVTTGAGSTAYVLKVHNAAFSAAELNAQDAAMRHLASHGLRVPVPVPGRDGVLEQHWSDGGQRLSVRLLSFLEGQPLASRASFTDETVAGLGRIAGAVARQLSDFSAPGLDRVLQWDLRQAPRVVERLAPHITHDVRRERVREAAAAATSRLAGVRDGLRVQPIHGDVTDDNVLAAKDSEAPDAVLDFGDLAEGWLVAELATTVASILRHLPTTPLAALSAVRAFDELVPLTDAEVAALWPLVVLRGATLVASGEHQVRTDAGNQYAEERTEDEWSGFELATRIGFEEAEAAVRDAVRRPTAAPVRLLDAVATGDVEVLDFSVTSHALDEGRWLEPGVEWDVAREALSRVSVAAAAFGEHRLTRAVPHSRSEAPVLAQGWELFVRSGEIVSAPLDCDVVAVGPDHLVLSGGGVHLRVQGLTPWAAAAPGSHLAAGSPVGRVAPQVQGWGRLGVQRLTDPHDSVPMFTTPSQERDPGRALDPADVIGLTPGPRRFDPASELRRRSRVFASAQERYYRDPPQIERGWKQHLVSSEARVYLDMVNNVTIIGHAHPRQVAAVAGQLALVNTNSRFLYRALADLSERLVELAPDPSLDTVLLVNSGTEAVELALRLAQVHTGRRDVVALQEGYHGWSTGADAITTSASDNPGALATRPAWVEVADVPNPYRGRHRGRDSATAYVADLRQRVERMVAQGRPPAAFVCEPVLGNAGGVLLPEGYLRAVYDLFRRHGGLCIADEVQVGLGRLGHHTWGVQQQGAVPDLICIAKAIGNGYPLGAVITRRDVAESLAREGSFFSSAGGSPASSVAGLAVLDVIRDEGLQRNAARVGDHLAERLSRLADRHRLIGAVHGTGLYLGVELVRDRETLEPAAEEAAALCERLLGLGVIVQPTSERRNVLKIKPPLCLDLESADFFVDALDDALAAPLDLRWSRGPGPPSGP